MLVAGDELNYYSNKYNNSPFTHTCTKTTFFMQRAVKNENLTLRRKPYLENCRIATSEWHSGGLNDEQKWLMMANWFFIYSL